MINQSTIVDKLRFMLKVPSDSTGIDTARITARARETLADTVAPFRWSEETLSEFVSGGVLELKQLRSDIKGDDVPVSFEPALADYVISRAFALDNDAQNNNGGLSDKYMSLFVSLANSVPFFFSQEELAVYADEAVVDLVAKRPDLRIADGGDLKDSIRIESDGSVSYDVHDRYTDAICFCSAGRAAAHSKNDAATYFFDQYNGALRAI